MEADSEDGGLRAKDYLIIDRDTTYTEQFRRLIRDAGTKVIRPPPSSRVRNSGQNAARRYGDSPWGGEKSSA
jgi:hypothetical protein